MTNRLTIEEFLEKYNYAPWGYEKLARVIRDELVLGPEVAMAKQFLDAKAEFETALESMGYEHG
jgi:hypothetical protein